MLIVYYSMDGNTRQIEMRLQQALGGDIEESKPVSPYTGSDDLIVKHCEDEVKSNIGQTFRLFHMT